PVATYVPRLPGLHNLAGGGRDGTVTVSDTANGRVVRTCRRRRSRFEWQRSEVATVALDRAGRLRPPAAPMAAPTLGSQSHAPPAAVEPAVPRGPAPPAAVDPGLPRGPAPPAAVEPGLPLSDPMRPRLVPPQRRTDDTQQGRTMDRLQAVCTDPAKQSSEQGQH